MILYKLTVETYEKSVGDDYPVVTHIFRGQTKEEAESYFNAHKTTDEFFRACQDEEQFGNISCWNQERWDVVEI